jgi:phosphatidylinositol glycan class M
MGANADSAPWLPESRLLLIGFAMRVILLVWGAIQDETMLVKFTDIDYFVFSDAARYLSEGKSPYDRTPFR